MFLNQSDTVEILRDWEHYPSNLSAVFTQDNLELCHRRLQNDAKRLFNPDITDVRLETVHLDRRADTGVAEQTPMLMTDSITDETDLEEVLIPHSWAPFNNSEDTFRKIFTAVKVRPSFLDFVRAFGQPEGGYETDFSGGYDCYHGNITSDGPNFEFFYNIRYVVKTGRDGWPWSERRMGVYHKYDDTTDSSTWIILQPTASARKLPKKFSSAIRPNLKPVVQHIFLFRSTSQSWKDYLKYLESQVRKDSRQARLDASTELHVPKPDFDLAFSNVQSLQHRCELIHDAILVLRSNVEILIGLQSLDRRMVHILGTSPVFLDHSAETCMSLFKTHRKWAEAMLDRAKQVSSLMTTLLNSKHSQALTSNTASMNRLAEAAKEDGRAMLALTKSAKKDAGTMKLIAAITMIYLPGTFVALTQTDLIQHWIRERVFDRQ
ncbi:uncharacterized protein BDZ99DRAFT_474619 [Mytilinidion resinicola]|uniref:CorA-like transporter domain-containing protein n=1 Tax=Mytilinidion resinicola TaxID=574789 RepID=A0A6A6YU21_9PEZI|nr:uncharacterized protein BDZ99DRAFT_474619 [Mytilinidion resinicola]KAF2812456.1 hypothetical protein BDZ99DRAFT_474619 [Mytilinidion resinicola]